MNFKNPHDLVFPTHLIPISIVPVGPSAAFGAAWGPLGTIKRPEKMSKTVYARLGCAYARREFWRQVEYLCNNCLAVQQIKY